MPHDHHHHGNCAHESTDSDYLKEIGIQYSLYEKIDLENLECLNEEEDGSVKNVFKPWEQRLDGRAVNSDCEAELLFNIPFTGNVKLKGITILGGNDETHPKKLKIFKNRPKMTFDDAAVKADEEFELEMNPTGEIEYPLKPVIFSSVHHLSLFIQTNYGGENTTVYYIGLRGEFSEAHYHGVTICTYEARPNMSDHKGEAFDSVNKSIH